MHLLQARHAAGNKGAFSINLWIKPSQGGNNGSLFGYILSATANATRTDLAQVDTFAPNNINLFLPQAQHPAYGMVRHNHAL